MQSRRATGASPAATGATRALQLWRRGRDRAPGLMACAVAALAGQFLADRYGAPALLLALLLGFALFSAGGAVREREGIDWCAGPVLRWGVALLGARIGLAEFQQSWSLPLIVVAVTVPLTLVLALLGGRLLGLPAAQALVAGAAVAICGVAAAVALAAALPRDHLESRRLLGVVAVVPALGTLALIVYPTLTGVLGFDEIQAGVLLGATIHDVGQATASGYLISEDAGHMSTLTKLMRVSLLAPLVLLTGLWFHRGGRRAVVPWFLFGFAALMALNSAGWLTPALREALSRASHACLLLAMVGLGARTSLHQLVTQGWRPVALLAVLSIALLAASAILIAGLSGPVPLSITSNSEEYHGSHW